MKMSTLRTSSGNKPNNPDCRQAFSERFRGLAVGLPDGSFDLSVYRRRFSAQRLFILFSDAKACLMHSLHAQAVPARETEPERELSPGFQRQRLWSLRGSSKGERIETLPFGESLLPFFSSRKEGPAPARGASLRQQK